MAGSFCVLMGQVAPPSSNPVAIRGVRVVDGTGKPAWTGNVLLAGDRIQAAGPDVQIPAEATVVDGAGKTVMPGLFDLHTHLPYSSVSGVRSDWPKNLAAYLLSGVTTVADFGTYGETFAPMRELLSQGTVQGPHILFAYRMTSPGGHGAEGGRPDIFTLEAQTPREARVAVRTALSYKPDVIKVFTDGWRYGTAPDMSSMDEDTLCALVDEAHRASIRVLTHTVTLAKAKIASRCKVDVLAHSIGDAPVDEELIRLMRENKTAYVATLAVYEPRPRDTSTPHLQKVLTPNAFARLGPSTPRRAPALLRRWEFMTGNVKTLKEAGIAVGSGTDAGVTGTHHGWATLRELKLLVESGFTPLEAISAATSVSAEAVGLSSDRGTIAPGKRADVTLVDGNPDERIEDADKVVSVYKDGKQVDLNALSALVASPTMSPIPSKPITERVLDDFEQPTGVSRLGTKWVNGSDGGHDRSRIAFTRTLRKPGDHALTMIVHMAEKDRPFARMILPLHGGGVVPADVSSFRGIEFDVRGEGEYRLLAASYASETRQPGRTFEAQGNWRTVKLMFRDFAELSSADSTDRTVDVKWAPNDVLLFAWEIARPAGETSWLEIDNVRLF